jgi:cell division protein FtsZ
MSLYEINQAAAIIRETAHADVNLIFGAVIDESMEDEIRITVIATGFDHSVPTMRTMRPAARPSREPVQVAPRPASQSTNVPQREKPSFRVNDLDIPAFLRKRPENS